MNSIEGEKIFRKFSTWRDKSGNFIDPYLHSPINFQYQYGHYCLSAILLFEKTKNEFFKNEIKSILNVFLKDLLESDRRLGPDFNLEPIAMGALLTKDEDIGRMVRKCLEEVESYTDKELFRFRATDLFFLRNFVERTKKSLGIQIEDHLDNDNERIRKTAGSSGILYDCWSPSKKGVGSLIYHLRNLEILCSIRYFHRVELFDECIQRGFEFLYQMRCSDGTIGYYGRSMNSVYGYASLLLALSYASSFPFLPLDQILDMSETYEKLFERCFYNKSDDAFYLNFSQSDNRRCGYDAYMYYMVYNNFALSRYLLSEKVKRKKVQATLTQAGKYYLKKYYVDKESGFVSIGGPALKINFNYIGHLDSPISPNDPRYAPGAILVIDKGRNNIIPDLPKYSAVNRNLLTGWGRIKSKLTEIKNIIFLNKPSLKDCGFVPAWKVGGDFLCPSSGILKETNEERKTIRVEYNLRKEEWQIPSAFINKVFKRETRVDFKMTHDIVISETGIENHYQSQNDGDFIYSIRTFPDDVLIYSDKEIEVKGRYKVSFNFFYKKWRKKVLDSSSGVVFVYWFKARGRKDVYTVKLS